MFLILCCLGSMDYYCIVLLNFVEYVGHFHSELGFVYWEFDMAEGYLGLGFYLGTDHILYCLLDQEAEVLGGLESPIVD